LHTINTYYHKVWHILFFVSMSIFTCERKIFLCWMGGGSGNTLSVYIHFQINLWRCAIFHFPIVDSTEKVQLWEQKEKHERLYHTTLYLFDYALSPSVLLLCTHPCIVMSTRQAVIHENRKRYRESQWTSKRSHRLEREYDTHEEEERADQLSSQQPSIFHLARHFSHFDMLINIITASSSVLYFITFCIFHDCFAFFSVSQIIFVDVN